MEAKISVRNLVEFILRNGDIDNRIGSFSDQAMSEGTRIHRMIQKRQGPDYQAEVPLLFVYHGESVDITVDGRADGVITNDSGVTIDEIKSTYADVMRYREANPIHLAQARFYAYIVASERELDTIKVRMTYVNIETEEIKYFNHEYTKDELTVFVNEVCSEYEKWAKMELEWAQKRNASIETLAFPFPYREGQEELVKNVYYTICHKKKLFIEAPTGVGKTISTVYPALCAMGREKLTKIFYLTAKTITRTVASDTLNILRNNGLSIKSVVLTAKEKICMTGEKECNPDACPYAKGHFDRVNDCIFDMLNENTSYTREVILEYAQKYMVCPFEMALDASLFCDFIVGDYNYGFDPRAKLKRYFYDGHEGNYLLLCDEAHNLVDRAREMYSAELKKEDFLDIKHLCKDELPTLVKRAETCNKHMLTLKRQCERVLINPPTDAFYESLLKLYGNLEKVLMDSKGTGKKKKYDLSGELRDALLNYYFEIHHFLEMYDRLDENYTVYAYFTDAGDFALKLFCVNPKANLKECMRLCVSTILFSATLLPIQYYKELLSGTNEDYEVYAKSVFNPEKRGLFVANDVTSKYTRRTDDEYKKIATYIDNVVSQKHGNYMVFFPSYGFMSKVYDAYTLLFGEGEKEILLQTSKMTEEERENYLSRFSTENGEHYLIGFTVMGGIFSEGIDLKNDALIGAIVVGTGLPQVCLEQDIIKDFFDEAEGCGFDYAYTYPGMNKVLQASGRVIRTEEDIGIVVLLDERFHQSGYKKLFPREWNNLETASIDNITSKVSRFWDEWTT